MKINTILFDDNNRTDLLPLTFTRPVADIRIGILTIKERWEKYLGMSTSYLTKDYLQEKFKLEVEDENLLINASVFPDIELLSALKELKPGEALLSNDLIIAFRIAGNEIEKGRIADLQTVQNLDRVAYSGKISILKHVWEIFSMNGEMLIHDFKLLSHGRQSTSLSDTNLLIGKENIFCEEGASAEGVVINASSGPVYLGKDVELMEGTVVRGPFAILDGSKTKLSAKIYGPTTIGPQCKVGGEINNSVFQGYSNKAHDGFLGNSVIGEWCNIGADSNNSNLKNTYDEVKLWSYSKGSFVKTGLQFCGLIMGDHSKCGINTMFNTGTVIGVNVNLFGPGFQRNFVPSFSWGGTAAMKTYDFNKAVAVARAVFSRRNKDFDEVEEKIFRYLYDSEK